jgi:hypothetical protein
MLVRQQHYVPFMSYFEFSESRIVISFAHRIIGTHIEPNKMHCCLSIEHAAQHLAIDKLPEFALKHIGGDTAVVISVTIFKLIKHLASWSDKALVNCMDSWPHSAALSGFPSAPAATPHRTCSARPVPSVPPTTSPADGRVCG